MAIRRILAIAAPRCIVALTLSAVLATSVAIDRPTQSVTAAVPLARSASVSASGTVLHLPYLAHQHTLATVPEHTFVALVGGASWIVAALSETHVLVGDGPHVVTMDATDPANMREVGRSVPLPGLPIAIEVDRSRGLAVVAVSPDTLVTLDVRDPTRPTVLGRLAVAPPGDVRDVALGGEGSEGGADGRALWAVVVGGAGLLRVVDLSDGAAPRSIGALDLQTSVSQVVVENHLAIAVPTVGQRYPPISEPLDMPVVVDLSRPAVPRLRSRLTILDEEERRRPAIDLVLFEGVAYAIPKSRGGSCVRAFDLREPALPVPREHRCLPFLSRLDVDRNRRLLLTMDAGGVMRWMDLDDGLEILDATGLRASENPFAHGPTAIRQNRIFMAVDVYQSHTLHGGPAARPARDWQPAQAALRVFEIRGRGDLEAIGRRAHSVERVHQLVAAGDTALTLVEVRPRLSRLRRHVLAFDPRAPGPREIVWPLAGTRALAVRGDALFALSQREDHMQLQRWDARDPSTPEREAVVDLPPIGRLNNKEAVGLEGEAEAFTWAVVTGENDVWIHVSASASTPARATSPFTTTIVAVEDGRGNAGGGERDVDGALKATGVITLEGRVTDVVETGPYLAATTERSVLLLERDAARGGEARVLSETALPWRSRGRMAAWDGRLVLAERDVALLEFQDGRPVVVASHAFPRVGPDHGWHTSAMTVRDDVVHLAGPLGLRSLRVDTAGFTLLAATDDVPAIARWHAREWPGPFDEHDYASIAAVGEVLVADRRAMRILNEPLLPTGFTFWRGPTRQGAGRP